MTQSSENLPVMKYHNDMFNRVLDRHGITQDQVALESQLSASHISRIASGDRVLSPEVLRALWTLTRDPEILASITGNSTLVAIEPSKHSETPEQIEAMAVRSCARVLNEHGKQPRSPNEAMSRVMEIDHAIGSLAALRVQYAHRAATTAAHSTRGYRTVSHQTHLVDEVA